MKILSIVIDLILLIVLILFVYTGFRRGLISTLAGLLSFVLAFAGANLLARAGSPMVGTWIAPSLETVIAERLQETEPPAPETSSKNVSADAETNEDSQLVSLLRQLDLYDQVDQYIENGTLPREIAAGVAKTVSLSIASTIAYWVLFLLFSLVLRLVLAILVRALNLVAHLPGLRQLNRLGGLLLGAAEGLIIVMLAAWVLQLLAFWLPENTLEKTVLVRLLLAHNPFVQSLV